MHDGAAPLEDGGMHVCQDAGSEMSEELPTEARRLLIGKATSAAAGSAE